MWVKFVDVRNDPGLKKEYGVRRIPAQVFYDESGKILFRHGGYYSKQDILTKWKELGYSF